MKIVHCTFNMRTGGAQLLLIDIMNSLHSEGHELALIVLNDKWEERVLNQLHPDIPIYHFNRREGSKNPLSIFKMLRLLRRLNPSVVHCHEPNMVNVLWRRRYPCLLTVHDVNIPEVYQQKYDQLVAISQSVADDLLKRKGIKVRIVDNGIPVSSFRHRTNWELSGSEPFKVIQVSRMVHEKKGQDLLLKALAIMHQEDPEANITLDFVGGGPSVDFLKQLASDLGIAHMVNFLGNKERGWLKKELQTYHLLVQPSRFEGFGLTIVEAVAAGIPALAFDIEGPREILLHANALCRPEDASDLAAHIREIRNAYLEKRMKSWYQELFSPIKDRYSIKRTTEGYMIVYENLHVNYPLRTHHA